MNYRELLEYVKSSPGCIQTKTQQKVDSDIKYREWVKKQDKYIRNISKDK